MNEVRLREALDSDHPVLVGVVDEWWGRRVHGQLPRLWFRHFTGTSVVADMPDGRRIGFAVAFVSQDRPDEAYLHLVGVAPGRRRRGIGRALVGAVEAAVRVRGAKRMVTTCWPGDPIALAFLRGVGFEVDAGPETMPLYGTPARTDWDREGDDRVLLSRSL